MPKPSLARLWSACLLSLSLIAPLAAGTSLVACSKPGGAAAGTIAAKGVIKSFGPEKKFVAIAHEAIPNYMAAMTMTFEPASPSQLGALAVGDKVDFSFKDEGGKRTITEIKKAP
jgi:Cu(I)/Ag(I) efflux system periplasmic protein CusF